MIVIVASQLIWPTQWWFFWPLLIWSILFTLHVMVMRTIDIDDEWVEKRSEKISDNAFDYAQMDGIREQVSKTTYGEAYSLKTKNHPPRQK
jgi:hypothetical protein